MGQTAQALGIGKIGSDQQAADGMLFQGLAQRPRATTTSANVNHPFDFRGRPEVPQGSLRLFLR